MWFQGLICLLSCLASVRSEAVHVHDSTFTPDVVLRVNRRNISVGGVYRYSTLINDTLPGPTLRFPENKHTWIRVHNDMSDDNLTMHWHGLAQFTYPFSDGTPLASQWPIPPQHFFDYEIKFANGSAGTYFYHSHVGFQATTASGPLIIEEASGVPPYRTDGERIIHLQELFNMTDDQAAQGLEATPMVWTGESNSWLVNGKGISNYGAIDPQSQALEVINVEPSKQYRFRYIGGTTLSYASMAYENHTDSMQVIEADGQYTQPHPIDVLQIGAGQRFSTLFQTKSCDELAALKKLDFYLQIESRDRPSVTTNWAILRYDASICHLPSSGGDTGKRGNFSAGFAPPLPTDRNPPSAPLTLPPTIEQYLDFVLSPLRPAADFPAASAVSRRVFVNMQQVANKSYTWRDDGLVWTEDGADPLPHRTPAEPYLVSLYRNQTRLLPNYTAALAHGGLDPGTATFPTRIGEVVELVLQQYGGLAYDGSQQGALDTHPWHSHGVPYWDLGGGVGAWDPQLVEAMLADRTGPPPRRDTTMVFRHREAVRPGEKMGWRVWRIRVTDPGVWMVHCHWLQHMVLGMQTVWVHGDAEDLRMLPLPLMEGYLSYGGSVYGNATYAPRVVHFDETEVEERRSLRHRR